MAIGNWLGPALQIGSTVLDVGAAMSRGRAAKVVGARKQQAAEFEAAQLDLEAERSRSIGMAAALEEQRKTQLINSAALARAAASGAGASDPTVINLLTKTAGIGAHRAAIAMYQGEAQARLDTSRAITARFEGETAASDASVAAQQANMTAMSTLLSGGVKVLSMYDKYWAGPQIQDRS